MLLLVPGLAAQSPQAWWPRVVASHMPLLAVSGYGLPCQVPVRVTDARVSCLGLSQVAFKACEYRVS